MCVMNINWYCLKKSFCNKSVFYVLPRSRPRIVGTTIGITGFPLGSVPSNMSRRPLQLNYL